MVAANAVAVMVVNIGAIACRGFANATTIIISQELGKDHKDTAREYGKRIADNNNYCKSDRMLPLFWQSVL